MAQNTPNLIGGVHWNEIRADSKRRAAWKQLRKVNDDGKHCLQEFANHEKKLSMIAVEQARLETVISQIDNFIIELRRLPREFNDGTIPPATQLKIETQQERRRKLMQERRALLETQATSRMALVRLKARIEQLRHSQRNLTAVVQGDNPAHGAEGGAFRVMG